MSRIRLVIVLLTMVTACTAPSRRPTELENRVAWAERQVHLSEQDDWLLGGRIALRYEGEGWNAGLRWEQIQGRFKIDIFGPLGRTIARLENDSDMVRVRTSKGEQAQAPDPEALMHRVLGWSLPVSRMRYWVLGIPDPNHVNQVELDGAGRPARLVQDGWQIRYQKYERTGSVDLPVKMILESADLRLKLAVKNWHLPPQ